MTTRPDSYMKYTNYWEYMIYILGKNEKKKKDFT